MSDASKTPGSHLAAPIAANVAKFRKELGWTLQAAAKKCHINASVFSRLENGDIRSLHDRSVRRIAEGFNVSVAALLQKASQDGETSLKVGFVHSLDAGAAVIANDHLTAESRCCFTSYGKRSYGKPDQDGRRRELPLEPVFHPPGRWGDPPPPRFNAGDSSVLRPCNASNLVDLLLHQKIHAFIAPREAISNMDKEKITPVVRLGEWSGSAYCGLFYKRGHELDTIAEQGLRYSHRPGLLHVIELWRRQNEGKTLPRVKAFYTPRTLSQYNLQNYMEEESFQWMETVAIDSGDWEKTRELMLKALQKDECILYLSGQPEIYWFDDWQKTQSQEFKMLDSRDFGQTVRLPYTVLDLMVRADLDPKHLPGLRNLVEALKKANRQLRDVRELNRIDKYRDLPVIQRIAGYMDTDWETVRYEICSIHYQLLYHEEGVKLLADHPSVR